jgi:hypothetical protein
MASKTRIDLRPMYSSVENDIFLQVSPGGFNATQSARGVQQKKRKDASRDAMRSV